MDSLLIWRPRRGARLSRCGRRARLSGARQLIDRLLIVGNADEVHVGAHFLKAARQLAIAVQFRDSSAAFGTSTWRQRVDWWARGRRPSRLREFSAEVVRDVDQFRPSHLLTTGIAPLDGEAMAAESAARASIH